MSALPPKADIAERRRHVRFVPKADIQTALSVVVGPVGFIAARRPILTEQLCSRKSI
jgi:hypothetical protein